MEIRFEVRLDRFVLVVDGKEVSWIVFSKKNGEINLLSTHTAKGETGKGYASKIVDKTLEHIKDFDKIKVSCPYIKRRIEKKGYSIDVEYTELLRLKESIDRFNEFRSPEAKAEFVRSEGEIALVKFTGSFCRSCGVYDYFEDLIQDQDVDAKIEGYEEVEDGFVVRYRVYERTGIKS
jgi:predicted GNAT family acetyltransferase